MASAATVGLCWLWLSAEPSVVLYLVVVVALFGLGVWASDVAGRVFDCEDDGRIVIDEVVGQLLALLPLVFLERGAHFFPAIVTGFVLFRVFDIWKPGLVGRAERDLHGGLGVMADDVVAGLLVAALLALGLVALGVGIGEGAG